MDILSLCPDIQCIVIMYLFPHAEEKDIEICQTILDQSFGQNPMYFAQKKLIFDKLISIYQKYSAHPIDNYNYKHVFASWTPKKYYIGGGPLYDSLSTGCGLPYTKSTCEIYDSIIDEDIKFMIANNPLSIQCSFGTLICRDHVTPLGIACINPNIPIHIVELLLLNGADPNSQYYLNGYPINILADMEHNVSSQRYDLLKVLFVKYGMNI